MLYLSFYLCAIKQYHLFTRSEDRRRVWCLRCLLIPSNNELVDYLYDRGVYDPNTVSERTERYNERFLEYVKKGGVEVV